jgi:four helix bundle protein
MKKFNFEELDIWQRAVDFADEVIDVAEKLNSPRQHYRLIEQLEAAATSVALNIAEGKGRYSKKEFIQYLYIARGSLFETVTLLKIFEKRDWVDKIRIDSLSNNASELAKMLNSFISVIKKSLV